MTFKLIKGSGPVYIHGQNIKDEVEVVDMEEEESEEEDDGEEDEIDTNDPPKKKIKTENNSTDLKNAKNRKK